MRAAFFFRAAQFFAHREDSDNERLYTHFLEVFEETAAGQGLERHTKYPTMAPSCRL